MSFKPDSSNSRLLYVGKPAPWWLKLLVAVWPVGGAVVLTSMWLDGGWDANLLPLKILVGPFVCVVFPAAVFAACFVRERVWLCNDGVIRLTGDLAVGDGWPRKTLGPAKDCTVTTDPARARLAVLWCGKARCRLNLKACAFIDWRLIEQHVRVGASAGKTE